MVIVGDKLIKLAGNYALKLVAKKFKLDKVLEYVEKPNELDKLFAKMSKSVDRLFTINQSLEGRITNLESDSHPQRDFVVCEKCKSEVEEKKGKWYDK